MSGTELKQIEKKIKSELEPFLNGIRTERADFELFRRAYLGFMTRYARGWRVYNYIMQDIDESSKFGVTEEIRWLFVYLGIIESLGNAIVDMVIMLLVANGKDFHIECRYTTPRIRHAVSIRDLEKERVPLTTKLNSLKDNGILGLSSTIDSNLRNSIAHLKFDVDENEIHIGGKPAWPIISVNLRKLARAIATTRDLLSQLFKEMVNAKEKQ